MFLDDVGFGEWNNWGECSEHFCGGGTQERYRRCEDKKKCSGRTLVDSKPCNVQPCPLDGGIVVFTNSNGVMACIKINTRKLIA